jgi:hypothetical protein
MKTARPPKPAGNIGRLLRHRLRELERTPQDLAAAARVPPEYIKDLIAGRRLPPLPGRTDLYDRMTRFLQLGRNDLAESAQAEREAAHTAGGASSADVRNLVLGLCQPDTARLLRGRMAKKGPAEVDRLIERLLKITRGSVRRILEDDAAVRMAAMDRGGSYLAMRVRVIEFLDATFDTVTAADYHDFLRPRIAMWDIDLVLDVMRVVFRPQDRRARDQLLAQR